MDASSFRYDGKRAVVVGGATGMGAATARLVADLGADVVVLDRATVELDGVTAGHVDMSDRDSIDAAVDALDGPVDALFLCAGVADGTPGIERINFIGHRHLVDRALAADLLPRGAAVGMISSTAGLAWEANWELVEEYLATPDWDAAVAWIEAHPGKADYLWSKQAVCGYVAREATRLLTRGIRINATLPGPTTTPLALDNKWLPFGEDYREATGIEASTPEEQAGPLAFLCSDAAGYVTGVTLVTDAGYTAAGTTASFPPAKPMIDFLSGKV